MPHQIARRSAGAIAALSSMLALAPVAIAATPAQSSCSAPALSTPFSSFGDPNQYAIAPGESANSFTGSGWTLSGAAKIVPSTPLYGGLVSGSVLSLQSGGKAVSPPMCVTDAYSSLRSMLKTAGAVTGVSVSASFSYTASNGKTSTASTSGAITPASTGAWGASSVMDITPVSTSNWQLATFTLTSAGSCGSAELYNLYVDPKMRS